MPFISVILPIYNVEKYIEQCISSIINQTFRDFELILVDDCTPDRSMEIAKETASKTYDICITYLRTIKNSGMSVARNMGIDCAKGKYLFFADSDDFLSLDCLEHLSKVAKNHPDADIIYGSSEETKDGQLLGKNEYFQLEFKNRPLYVNDLQTLSKMMLNTEILPICIWNRLFRHNWFESHNFHFQPGILAQDLHLDFFLAKHAKAIAICTSITYFYRIHSESVSIQKKSIQDRCVEWCVCDWMRHLSRQGLLMQLKLIFYWTQYLYLRKYEGKRVPPSLIRYSATLWTLLRAMLRNQTVPPDNIR